MELLLLAFGIVIACLLMAMRIICLADMSKGFLISTQQETIERLEREIGILRERLKETSIPLVIPERPPGQNWPLPKTNSEGVLIVPYRE